MAFLLSVFPLFFSFPYFILFCIKFPTSLRAARRLVCFLLFEHNRNKCFFYFIFSYILETFKMKKLMYYFSLFFFFFLLLWILFFSAVRSVSMFPLRMPLVLAWLSNRWCMFCILRWGFRNDICICPTVYLHGHLLMFGLATPFPQLLPCQCSCLVSLMTNSTAGE